MNIQEAIEAIKKASRHHCGEVECYKQGCTKSIDEQKVIDIISQIHEPQKAVVPRVIGDLIEELKIGEYTIGEIGACIYDDEEQKWIDNNEELFYRAWLDGYEVEQERLYTVEIPDPNSYSDYRYLSRNDNGICLDASNDTKWKQKKRNQFTESEIKQDFEWAWDAGFAKPVEVE
ncbi:TPA: DUF1642 domain-containing protein [Streptococcus suis]|nr:DUF1642 domain-containing protein [Streptococcus suis]HEM3701435.1 DUF1642 domain-containing protein [Streptococcus suis]